MKNATN